MVHFRSGGVRGGVVEHTSACGTDSNSRSSDDYCEIDSFGSGSGKLGYRVVVIVVVMVTVVVVVTWVV